MYMVESFQNLIRVVQMCTVIVSPDVWYFPNTSWTGVKRSQIRDPLVAMS